MRHERGGREGGQEERGERGKDQEKDGNKAGSKKEAHHCSLKKAGDSSYKQKDAVESTSIDNRTRVTRFDV